MQFFSKVSFAIIMVTNDINFLSTNTDTILWFPLSRSRIAFVVVVLNVVGLFFGFGFIRHNHPKPQIKRNSQRDSEPESQSQSNRVWCVHTKGGYIVTWTFHEIVQSTDFERAGEEWQTTANNYLIWYFLFSAMACYVAVLLVRSRW